MKKTFYILFILLFIFSCDSDDNPVSVSNEIDVDWVLVRTPNFNDPFLSHNDENRIGYYFYYKSSLMDFDGNSTFDGYFVNGFDYSFINIDDSISISFSYNGENYSFNIEDFGFNSMGNPNIGFSENVERIIFNQEMNFFNFHRRNASCGNSKSCNC